MAMRVCAPGGTRVPVVERHEARALISRRTGKRHGPVLFPSASVPIHATSTPCAVAMRTTCLGRELADPASERCPALAAFGIGHAQWDRDG